MAFHPMQCLRSISVPGSGAWNTNSVNRRFQKVIRSRKPDGPGVPDTMLTGPVSVLRLSTPLLLVVCAALTPASAQTTPVAEPTAEQAAAPASDPFGRETPRGTVTGLISALAAKDYTRAANFFYLSAEVDETELVDQRAIWAIQLQAALDQQGTLLPFGALSNEAIGRLDDGLPADTEEVGRLGGKENPPILLTRTDSAFGSEVWGISQKTVEALEAASPAATDPAEPEDGESAEVAGAPLLDWALLLGIAAGSFFLYWLISAGLLAFMRRFVADREKSAIYRFTLAALPPLSLFLAVVTFHLWAASIEASIVARQTLLRYIGIVGWVALAWFGLRLVDAVARVTTARMERQQRRQAVSVVLLLRRAAKILLAVIAMVAILDTLGFDVTTGLAALGIGGIALALGAQKAVENFIGSLNVVADRPAQVGDFCRAGDIVGTVEDIGMRSTRIRTPERTLVTIPNGDFSSREIENFAKRDRYLFSPTIGVEYGISAAELRRAVEIIEQILRDHEAVDNDGLRARFSHFGESSLDIEIWCYIMVADYAESRLIRQELLLAIFERLEEVGLAIAFPTRTVHLVTESD